MNIGGSAAQTNFFNNLNTAVYVKSGKNSRISTCVIEGSPSDYWLYDGSIGVDLLSSRDIRVDNCSFQYLEKGIQSIYGRGQIGLENNGPFETMGNSIEVDNFTIIQNQLVDPIDIRVHDNFNIISQAGTCIKVNHTHGSGKISILRNLDIKLGAIAAINTAPAYGIELSNVNGLGSASILFNDVLLRGRNKQSGAILISNVPINTLVWQNEIQLNSYGLTDFGILAANTVDCHLVENIINGYNQGQSYSMNDAIRVDMSQSSILCCNHPDNTANGITYLGPNTSDIANTDFKHHFTRLFLYQVPGLGLQIHNGNRWDFSDANKIWDAKYDGVINQVPASRFVVDPILLPDIHNKIEVVGGTQTDKENWFVFEEGERTTCEVD
ncbi:MAG: hypothetical protein Q8K92_25150, partial [Leadbetterella sp.]|nr:hypothetical protein [Leadbetterella sp.]